MSNKTEKIKLDSYETLVVRHAKGWYDGTRFEVLSEKLTGNPKEYVSEFTINQSMIRTAGKILSGDEFAWILENAIKESMWHKKEYRLDDILKDISMRLAGVQMTRIEYDQSALASLKEFEVTV